MLAILRKIRKSLINTGKVSKYLIYALGEIVLVVIGILIALQINNWNEIRKKRIVEQEILLEIKNDLVETLYEDLNEDLESHISILRSTNAVIKALVLKAPYSDTLSQHLARSFGDTRTYYKIGGYQNMLSNGSDIIENDSLRKAITDLYQLGFTRLDESAEEYDHRKELRPYLSRHFTLKPEIVRSRQSHILASDSMDYFQPVLISYEMLLNDNQYMMELRNSMQFRQRKIRRCYQTQARIERVLALTEKELK
jgi:hypothetical protein